MPVSGYFLSNDPKTISYLLIFLSLYFFIELKRYTAFFLLGLSIVFHPMVGIWASAAFFSSILYLERQGAIHIFLKSIPYWLLGSSYGLYKIFQHLFIDEKIDKSTQLFLNFIRNAHHVDFNHFFKIDWRLIFIFGIVLVSTILLKNTVNKSQKFVISLFQLYTINFWNRRTKFINTFIPKHCILLSV